jgi:carbon monoxide dehydrogenase subunit G
MKVEVTADVAASSEIVFATLTDLEGLPAFISGIRSVEILDPGPLRVGTRFRETRMMFGREATEEMTFAVLDPPRRFVLTAENHGARYVTTHDVAASGVGSRVTLTFEGVPVTFAARLFRFLAPIFAGNIRKHLAGDLAAVKAEAERRAKA